MEILSVRVEDGETVGVPLTPPTTFKDVAACVREPGDSVPLIVEKSPLGARVVASWERPLELLRLWGVLRDQISYTASYSFSEDMCNGQPSAEETLVCPWELYELKDNLKELKELSLDDSDEVVPGLTSDGENDACNHVPLNPRGIATHISSYSLDRAQKEEMLRRLRQCKPSEGVQRGTRYSSSLPSKPSSRALKKHIIYPKEAHPVYAHIPNSILCTNHLTGKSISKDYLIWLLERRFQTNFKKQNKEHLVNNGRKSQTNKKTVTFSLNDDVIQPENFAEGSLTEIESQATNSAGKSPNTPCTGNNETGSNNDNNWITSNEFNNAIKDYCLLYEINSINNSNNKPVTERNKRSESETLLMINKDTNSATTLERNLPEEKPQELPRLISSPQDSSNIDLKKIAAKVRSNVDILHQRSYSDPVSNSTRDTPYIRPTVKELVKNRRRTHSGENSFGRHEGMKESQSALQTLPDGCELTVPELREMASRQQAQIEAQQQLLVVREQRLKYLKQQETHAAAVAAEAERMRRLKERVEAQEAKLRRLRALRGQVESTRQNTASLTNDLDTMRHLFSEKEKELVVAVAKVDELTQQLEELRSGRSPLAPNNHQHHAEVEKLRRELLFRNNMNREASARVASQKEALAARKDEVGRINKRIAELQQRLHRKRILNQQLASQISAATQAKQAQLKAVQQKALREGRSDNIKEDEEGKAIEDFGEFGRGKQDPKYQTLPYNTKFSSAFKSSPSSDEAESSASSEPSSSSSAPSTVTSNGVVTRTVHSIPTPLPSKGHAFAPTVKQSAPASSKASSTSSLPQQHQPYQGKAPPAASVQQKLTPCGTSLPTTKQNALGPQQQQEIESAYTAGHLPVSSSVQSSNFTSAVPPPDDSEGCPDEPSLAKSRPILPPKPTLSSKPLLPPRQKGDPMAGSSESLNTSGVSTSRSSSQNKPHAYRYASQNVIVSTYTQLQAPPVISDSLSNDAAPLSRSDVETSEKVHVSINRRIEMPPDYHFPEDETPPSDLLGKKVEELENSEAKDTTDRTAIPYSELEKLKLTAKDERLDTVNNNAPPRDSSHPDGTDSSSHDENQNGLLLGRIRLETDVLTSWETSSVIARRHKKGNLKSKNSTRLPRRVSFDPLALLLDASLEGELELVKQTALEVPNPSAANDEGITALHNAICAGHLDIVTFLVKLGCDVNAHDSDGWTPLHCAASCNNLAMVKFLVEHGACILATTQPDHETPAEKCEQDEEGYDGCSQYLCNIQEKLGVMNGGVVYAVYDYDFQNDDELSFRGGDSLTVIRRGDEYEREWWWAQLTDKQGYVPRNLLGLYPRVKPSSSRES